MPHHVMEWLLVVLVAFTVPQISAAPSFVISEDQTTFLKDGVPFRLISGSVHYFRIHPAQYLDRVTKAKMCGLNAVQTYAPWNYHNPEPDTYDFNDLISFLEAAQTEGLLVILRGGPYMCGEWDFGGFPYWLVTKYPDLVVRAADPNFLAEVDKWWSKLLPVLQPYLYSNGGNVVLLQVENEYGSYGTDKQYLQHLLNTYQQYLGTEVLYYSTDGSASLMLQNSYISGIFQTVDFGSYTNPSDAFAVQHNFTNGPFMNSEYYTGWLTHWGDAHAGTANTTLVVNTLEEILSYHNASVNFYMFSGSTNFGFWNGANSGGPTDYEPVITSYDYDSPISEAGDPTDKYFAIRKVISQFAPVPSGPLPTPSQKGNYGQIQLTSQAYLFDQLTPPLAQVFSNAYTTLSLEKMGQRFGYALYSTYISGAQVSSSVWDTTLMFEPKDMAWVYLNGTFVGKLLRAQNNSLPLTFANNSLGATFRLDILVENMGRVNYGWNMVDYFKGIPGGVRLGNGYLFGWTVYSLPFEDVSSVVYSAVDNSTAAQPAFFKGTFNVAGTPLDTFLDMTGWGKGVVFINGFNLGRFWFVGPQYTLYVPAPILITGINEVVVFASEGRFEGNYVTSRTEPIYS